jgi:hypothetical protein
MQITICNKESKIVQTMKAIITPLRSIPISDKHSPHLRVKRTILEDRPNESFLIQPMASIMI